MVRTPKIKQKDGKVATVADPEVPAKPTRRTFTAAYKLDVLRRADQCTEPGEIGELLRKEGLYSSNLNTWRHQRDAGALKALGKKRGRKVKPSDNEKLRLQREVERLRRKLEQAEQIIEIQKKVASLLGIQLANDENGEKS